MDKKLDEQMQKIRQNYTELLEFCNELTGGSAPITEPKDDGLTEEKRRLLEKVYSRFEGEDCFYDFEPGDLDDEDFDYNNVDCYIFDCSGGSEPYYDPKISAFNPTDTSFFGDFGYAYVESGIAITKYFGLKESVSIPSGIKDLPVTVIDDCAFENCILIKHVHIPDTVTKIGTAAFRGCTNLKAVKIPAGVTEIGDEAFDDHVRIERI